MTGLRVLVVLVLSNGQIVSILDERISCTVHVVEMFL